MLRALSSVLTTQVLHYMDTKAGVRGGLSLMSGTSQGTGVHTSAIGGWDTMYRDSWSLLEIVLSVTVVRAFRQAAANHLHPYWGVQVA